MNATTGDRQVTLTWSESTDASGISAYRLYRAAGPIGAFSLVVSLPPAARSYVDTNLVNKTEYRYYMTAVDAAPFPNVSAPSFIRTVIPTDTGAPNTPTLAGSGFDKKVVLTWGKITDSSGLKGYQLWRSSNGGLPLLRATPGASAVTFADATVLNDTTYQYTLRAVDKVGNVSAHSNAFTVTPVDDMPPSVPAPLVTAGDGKLSLKWAAAKDTSGVGSYTIYRATGLGSFAPIATVGPMTLTYVDNGLSNYTTYRYYMTATDIKNQTSNASAIQASYPKDLTGPAAVTVSGSVSDGRAHITWSGATDVSGIVAYRVYRAMGAATSYSAVGSLPPDARAFTQTGLTAGTAYRYLVRAVDAKNNLGVAPAPLTLTTPMTGMTVQSIAHTRGTPGSSTTPVSTVITLRSNSPSQVPVAGARVSFQIRNVSESIVSAQTVTTSQAGTATVRSMLPKGASYHVVIIDILAVGRVWDGSAQDNIVFV